jgi:hypothetical protein
MYINKHSDDHRVGVCMLVRSFPIHRIIIVVDSYYIIKRGRTTYHVVQEETPMSSKE